MNDELQPQNTAPHIGLKSKLFLARLTLVWEMLWRAIWPAVMVAGLFLALGLFDFLPVLPSWLHLIVLTGFAAGLVWAIRRGWRAIYWPGGNDAKRRLELASGLSHRPLTTLDDRLSSGDEKGASAVLWSLHQRRIAAALENLRVGIPAPGLARRDPMALRIAVTLLLLIAVTAGWGEAPQRLARAVLPSFDLVAGDTAPVLDLWITPPQYTQLPPLFPLRLALQAVEQAPVSENASPPITVLRVPSGSQLTAQLRAVGKQVPDLIVGEGRTPFERVDPNHTRIAQEIKAGGRLAIALGDDVLGEWQIEILPDAPPSIAFTDPPGATPQASLRLSYDGSDDYGIKSAHVEIRRTYEHGAVTGKAVHRVEVPLPSRNARAIRETAFLDLAPHRWAGLPVIIDLIALDALDQTGRAVSVRMTLPERQFLNPVARAIIEQRRRLADQPENRRRVVIGLGEIASVPGAFSHDSVVYLALASARARLVHEKTSEAIDSVLALLWETALRLEDGRLSVAERDLHKIQRELMKALAEGASDAKLERLMRELRAALSRYLQALAEQMRRNPQGQQAMEFDPATMRLIRGQDLARMLDQIRDLMRSGSRDAARQLLSRLQQMLEGMRSMQVMRRQGGQSRQGGRALRRLQDLIRQQQGLMDRSFQSSRPGQPGSGMPGPGEQEALRELLRQLRSMMPGQGRRPGQGQGSGPGQLLDKADGDMGNAIRALQGSRPGDATGPQGRALNNLRQAGKGLMQQMLNRFGRQSGGRLNRQGQRNQPRRDPLGREFMGEEIDSGNIAIPDEASVQRARSILDELRRRSGQGYRPRLELDYINRLLQRF
jgi:uncharacterized protein (TIGR02302 family)